MSQSDKIGVAFQKVAQDIKVLQTTASGKLTKDSLLIYYGYPRAYRGIWSVEGVVAAISEFNYYICGDTYQDPAHEEYAFTVQIIEQLRAKGTKVYGYVPIGVSTSNLSIAMIKTRIDQWANIGVDGIFLDEFGFDYNVPRSRQIEAVNHVYSKNLPYTANAWTFEDFVCNNVSELPWPSNDWRYVNFTTYNPNNLVLPRTSKDSYLIENFCYDNTQALDKFDAQERYSLIRSRNKALAAPAHIWAVAVFGESPLNSGNVDLTKIGSLSLADVPNYVVANAWIFDIEVLGIGGFSFGAAGTPVIMSLPPLPAGTKLAKPLPYDPAVNLTSATFSRRIDNNLTVQTTNTGTQTVTITNAASKPIGTVPSAGGEIPANAVFTDKRTYTNDVGRTSFPLVYTAPFVFAFVNGTKIPEGEYTATNGTSVVLSTALQNEDDVVDLIGFASFTQANTYSQAVIDGKFSTLTTAVEGKAPVDLSAAAVTEATPLSGAEIVPVHSGGYKKTTVAKILDWILGKANTWTGLQLFNNAVFTQMNGGQLAGFRNKIDNGKMVIAQRGTMITNAAMVPATLDRWSLGRTNTAHVIDVSQSSDVPATGEFQYSLLAQNTVAVASMAATDFLSVRQLIEGFNVKDLVGRTFTLSFWVKSAKAGIHYLSFRNATPNKCYVASYTITTANTWQKVSLTISGGLPITGAWDFTTGVGLRVDWMLLAGSNFHTTTKDTWLDSSATCLSDIQNFCDTNLNAFYLTGAQLEIGTRATPFEHRVYQVDLAICQRYLPAFTGSGYFGSGFNSSKTTGYAVLPIAVTPRVAPTYLLAMTGSAFNIANSAGNLINLSGVSFNNASLNVMTVTYTATSGLTANSPTFFGSSNANTRLLFLGAEL